jgi:hypothetical protein
VRICSELVFRDVNENFKKVLKVAKVVIDELLKCFDIYIEVLKNLKNLKALEKVLKQFIERENLLEGWLALA